MNVSSLIMANGKCVMLHTRLSKTAMQGKDPDGKWTRKPLVYRESIHLVIPSKNHLCLTRKSTTWSLINLSNNLQITDVKLTGL